MRCYTGQRLDPDSGLYYCKARWYSPYLGRFLQTDPIGQADDVNLYIYVKNDPVSFVDPTGTILEIRGPASFRAAVERDLAIIGSQPGGAALISKLKATPHLNIIEPSINGKNLTEWGTARPGKPGGTRIRFNPDRKTGGVDIHGNAERPTFVGLAHELGHARAMNLGKQTDWTKDSRRGPLPVPESEVHSMANENMIRKEHGLPIRPGYTRGPASSNNLQEASEFGNANGKGNK